MCRTPGTHERYRGRSFVAVVMLLLWVGTFVLASSPQLHRLLHTDSGDASHYCLITQIQQHPLVAGGIATVVPAAPTACAEFTFGRQLPFASVFDYRFAPSRAPPLAVLTTTAAS